MNKIGPLNSVEVFGFFVAPLVVILEIHTDQDRGCTLCGALSEVNLALHKRS